MTQKQYESNKQFIKAFSKHTIDNTISKYLIIILIPLICLGLDLKLETFTNACISVFLMEFIWLAGNTIQLLVRAFRNKKYEQKNSITTELKFKLTKEQQEEYNKLPKDKQNGIYMKLYHSTDEYIKKQNETTKSQQNK